MKSKISAAVLLALVFSATSRAAEYDTTRWQDDIDAFVRADQTSSVEPGGVVFVGSSSIRMWDLEKSFPGKEYLNRGFGGSEIVDSTHFFTELVAQHQPRLVVFYAGDNDISAGKLPSQVASDFLDFAELFLSQLPDSKLIYISIKPSIARLKLADKMREANKRIAAECAKNDKFMFLDVWPVMLDQAGQPRGDIFLEDGLHMNDAGYKLWNELLTPHLE
ncbi:MAG: GDSL-type esterase/lipase family protein [Bythopirellula sp.]|nr:GDSL-type esterase/lipase family protein [Bythopirellula sp.]